MKFSTNNRVSGDSWRLMWRHCNLLPYLSGEICQDARRCEAKRDGVIWSDDQHCGWQAGRVLSEIPAAAQAHTWHLHSRHQYWLTLLGQGPLRSRVSVRAAGIHVLRRRGTWLCNGEGTSTSNRESKCQFLSPLAAPRVLVSWSVGWLGSNIKSASRSPLCQTPWAWHWLLTERHYRTFNVFSHWLRPHIRDRIMMSRVWMTIILNQPILISRFQLRYACSSI